MEKMRGFKLGGPGLKEMKYLGILTIQIKPNFDIKSHYFCFLALNINLTNSVSLFSAKE